MRKFVRSSLLIACLCSTMALGSQLALADDTGPAPGPEQFQGGHDGQHRRGHFFKKMVKELGLSDQQKAQAKALFKSNREASKPLFANLMTAKHQLEKLVASGTADPATIQAQAAALATAETNLAVQRAQGTKQFLALLTPDQVAKYNAMQAKREAKFQEFVSRMAAPPQGN